MGGNELKYIHEAFETNWISPAGQNLQKFEQQLADYTGVGHVAALSSGTAAIHLALIMLGVKQGDEVICSSFTFTGSCNPIVYERAIPVFVDSESETWNMDPELLRTAIKDRIKKGKKPKAIILVHLYGVPAKIDQILTIAGEYEIPVIEDAAEALGSKYKKRFVGTFGKIGVFSFNGNKIITTSGGGALVSENEKYVNKAKFLGTQARDQAVHYQHSEVGYNYRMSNICAGIGRGQVEVIDNHIKNRRMVFDYYKNELSSLEELVFPNEPLDTFCNRWLTTLLINSSNVDFNEVIESLAEENIECRPLWKPMHLQPIFKDAPMYDNGVSEALFRKGICLPSGSNLAEGEIKRVTNGIKGVFGVT